MTYDSNPKSIKYHVKQYLTKHQDRLRGKKVVDLPAGNGITCQLVEELGGTAYAFDLFPEYFQYDKITCQQADVMQGVPLADAFADFVICQEGIEHFTDQYKVFREFNRILKKEGSLIVTTPNYSNLRAKLSYLLSESERFNSMMAPNELDSIWMSQRADQSKIYFGHIFLIGIQKLRVLAKLCGFKISHIQFTRVKTTSLLLLPLFYPFIYASNWISYWKGMRKNHTFTEAIKKETYQEIRRLNTDPKILVDGHLFVEFTKERELDEVQQHLKNQHQGFGIT
ncbi:MAG: class I SAM-dependent methyltransferase [Thermonemataceae bacterium]